jgi:hypothetical protein
MKQINKDHLPQNVIDRYWRRVIKTPTCWLWQGTPCDKWGHCMFMITARPIPICYMVHRLSYYFHHNVDPYPNLVLHTCDVCNCVNPEHLYLGTHADNVNDMVTRNRFASQLDPEDVKVIRERCKTEKQNVLAQEYGVHQSTISRAINGTRNWKHIPL